MIVNIINIWVKPDCIEKFINATVDNHKNSVKESGNLRFDILQDASEPEKFTLYEGYLSEEAVLSHKETEHYAKWNKTVKDYMAKPRERIKHFVIEPKEKEKW